MMKQLTPWVPKDGNYCTHLWPINQHTSAPVEIVLKQHHRHLVEFE
jgi:hypothetical protein